MVSVTFYLPANRILDGAEKPQKVLLAQTLDLCPHYIQTRYDLLKMPVPKNNIALTDRSGITLSELCYAKQHFGPATEQIFLVNSDGTYDPMNPCSPVRKEKPVYS
jgi:hypothetical protein